MWKDFTRMTTEIWKRYKVDLLSKILEAFAAQCCPARPVWLYMLQRVRCVRAAAVGYKHRAENIINQTTTVKQELRADITSKHLRREAIQIDEVWSQFKTADIPDRSQMHEWKDCEIWSFQRYVCVCCDMNANVVPPDPLTEGERSDGEQRRRRWCICVCLYQAPVHTQALRKHWQTLITSIIQFHGNAILSLIPFLRFSLKKNHTNKTFWTAFLIPNVNSHTL